MSEALEKAARAMCASQLYDSAWASLNAGAQETYRTNARAAITAFLSSVGEESEVELRKITDAYNATEPEFLVDEDELRWAVRALRHMIVNPDKEA